MARHDLSSDHRDDVRAERECAFCRIARGAGQNVEVVCAEEAWLAFFPLDPATPGHTLIVPRTHAPDFWSLNEDLAAELSRAALRVGGAIDRALSPEGMNLVTSSGDAAEQTIFHVHLHVVPRWRHDGFGRIWPPDRSMSPETKDDVAELIRSQCAESQG